MKSFMPINITIKPIKIELFILTLFTIVGYVTYLPFFISNIIIFLVPLIFIFNLIYFKLTVSSKYILFLIIYTIIGSIPFIFYTDITSVGGNPFAIVLRALGPFIIYAVVRNMNITYNEICKIFILIYFLDFILVIFQFFIFPDVRILQDGSSVQWITLDSNGGINKRIGGFLGNANALAAYVLVTILFLDKYLSDKRKLKNVILISAFLTIILFTKSRNVIISVLVVSIYRLYLNKKTFTALILILFCMLFVFSIYIYQDDELVNSIFRISSLLTHESTLEARGIVNSQAANIWSNNFIFFGGGFSSESYYLIKFNSYANFSEMLYTKSLLEVGIVGLFSYLFFIFYVLIYKVTDSSSKISLKLIIFSILLISFAETVFYQQQLFYYTFIIFGFYASIKLDAVDKFKQCSLVINNNGNNDTSNTNNIQ